MTKRMSHSGFRLAAAFIAALVASIPISTNANDDPDNAGVAAAVRGSVQLVRGTDDPVTSRLKSGDQIFAGDVITTGSDGAFQILLLDESVIKIGAESVVSIDANVPNSIGGRGVSAIGTGTFRIVFPPVESGPAAGEMVVPVCDVAIRGCRTRSTSGPADFSDLLCLGGARDCPKPRAQGEKE